MRKDERGTLLCYGADVRVKLGLDRHLPPVRSGCVSAVLEALEDQVSLPIREDLRWLGDRLLWLADERGIGPGTTRLSMAPVAVYAAGRLVTQ